MEYGKDFENEVKINKYKLEDECERHPSLIIFYSKLEADLKAEKDRIKDMIDFVIGRETANMKEGEFPKNIKVTESYIAAKLATDTDIMELKEELRKVTKELYHVSAAMVAIEHRKSCLKNLTDLYQSQYFSKPQGTGRDVKENEYRKEMEGGLKRKKRRDRE